MNLGTFTTKSAKDLEWVVDKVKTHFKQRTLLLLEGPMGAGKTELVKVLAKSLGAIEVASPSFAIHHQYKNSAGHLVMDHLDLYRLEDEDDLESTGFWDLFVQKNGLIAIEWSDRLNQDLLPMNWYKIKIEIKMTSNLTERVVVVSEG